MSRILIIDDEEAIRFTLAQALRKQGYDVEEASDGNEALRILDGQPFDLVITDILMPNREGLETIIEIQANWPDIKIIAMSGGGRVKNTNFLALAKKFGAHLTIKKPFSIVQFRDVIAKVMQSDDTTASE